MSAVSTGETSSRSPAATPAKATWPIPSPMRLMRRWTRKKPTAGASTPITAPAAKASRMNSNSNMHVRGVVPDAGQPARCAVEDDPPVDEHQPLDVALHGAELVRDVEDRHRQLLVQRSEEHTS